VIAYHFDPPSIWSSSSLLSSSSSYRQPKLYISNDFYERVFEIFSLSSSFFFIIFSSHIKFRLFFWGKKKDDFYNLKNSFHSNIFVYINFYFVQCPEILSASFTIDFMFCVWTRFVFKGQTKRDKIPQKKKTIYFILSFSTSSFIIFFFKTMINEETNPKPRNECMCARAHFIISHYCILHQFLKFYSRENLFLIWVTQKLRREKE